ncbi:facilitated trehalose transporter Tret1-like isoform X2 [Aphidius gifuensis]|uniref:facilitated trehalose transporter Tret1-like isoform X2 n=1 Tax=Aphidius gifuensis TaxID=684658 RepID=UPI001CDC16AE|nr:facilitated trehalose transporter Tret1-like isoform X2 [Aphidius gifuensis]
MKNYWPQYLAATTATLSLAIAGSHVGWTSPSLPYLKSKESHLEVTSDSASWIASFYLLGSIPGNLLAAFIVDRYGRKSCLLTASIPLFIGWVLIIIAWNPYVLYLSRFISGIGQGVVYVVCPMYIGEIADKKIRGRLGSLIKLMVTLGELYAHAIGPFVSYKYLAYSCAIIPVLFFVSFLWMPESPFYLLMRQNRVGASKCLRKLGRYENDDKLDEVLDQMTKAVVKDMNDKGHFWDLFDTSGNRKAVVISFGLQVILQFSGIAAIESYTQEMIDHSDANVSSGIAVIILSVLQLIAGFGAAAFVDKIGRRPLLLLTTFLAGITLLISGVAVSLANLWASLLAFIVSKMYQVIADNFGIYVSFFLFSGSCFIGIVFIFFFVPETSGKSLMEIQEELNCGKKKNKIKISKDLNVNIITI